MRIIPVIDVLNKQVVQGIQGERDKYYPIKSVICDSAEIIDVVESFYTKFNFKDLYIADLDAITKNIEEFDYLKDITCKFPIKIMIDAGITTLDRVKKIVKYGITDIIIGTETLNSTAFIEQLLEFRKKNELNIIISIDLYQGKNISKCEELKELDALNMVKLFEKMGINNFIILDLYRVGSKMGGISDSVYQILKNTSSKIITGGGIKSIDDLIKIKNIGLDGILIATALHKGSITPAHIKKFF
ncbi:MAG: HisA/HisF-related TIM barrel protein [Candidatus Helarchaeota archaeon]